ncbi:MAG: glyoxalase [Lachnospiraceae bacterium]|nr:glyoxalase [Lachnospiraceae bacterium]
MGEYDEKVLKAFLDNQMQLFPEIVADSLEEAEYFLEDCMAVVCRNKKEVRKYFEEAGLDIAGMTEEELFEQSEVFAVEDGRYLIVEG